MKSVCTDEASETWDRKSLRRFAGYAPLTRGLNGAVRPSFGVNNALLACSLLLSPPQNRYAESGEEIVLDLSSISERVKQTSVGSHLYRDNGCNFGSFPVPQLHILSSPFLLDFTYAYAQIAEADRGGFDCTARDRRFINALSAWRSLFPPLAPASISRSEVKSPTLR